MMCARTLTTESEESRALISCQIEVMMLKCFDHEVYELFQQLRVVARGRFLVMLRLFF